LAGVEGQERLGAARTIYGSILTFKERLFTEKIFGAHEDNKATIITHSKK